jgi:hypothetical protein
MMHSTLHFGLGMAAATAWHGPALLRSWRAGRALARALGLWLVTSYALGLLGVVPNLLRRAGVPHETCEAWYMNVFLLSPFWNRLLDGGHIYGPAILTVLFGAQYAILLLAIRRARRG